MALHDRKVPGGRANIDHVAATHAAIWVIGTKRYPDKQVEFRAAGGWFCTPVNPADTRPNSRTPGCGSDLGWVPAQIANAAASPPKVIIETVATPRFHNGIGSVGTVLHVRTSTRDMAAMAVAITSGTVTPTAWVRSRRQATRVPSKGGGRPTICLISL